MNESFRDEIKKFVMDAINEMNLFDSGSINPGTVVLPYIKHQSRLLGTPGLLFYQSFI